MRGNPLSVPYSILRTLLALGVDLIFVFADTDQLDSSGAGNGPVKYDSAAY